MDLNLSPAITPETIVSANKKLSIPIYQRLFVWGEAQIDALLNDLWDARTSNEDYYLGVITVHENDSQQWEIVDGQQRLTFLTLLGCLFIKKGCEGQANWDGYIFTGDAEKSPRLYFHGRPADRDDILKFAREGASDFSNSAFARFAERFSVFANGKDKGELLAFSEHCFQHAAFLVNELPMTYGPEELNLYFEKMNSTGRQLTPLEVVKGKWFSPYAARWNACMNFDTRLEKVKGDTDGERPSESERNLTLQELLAGDEVTTESKTTTDPAESSKSRLVMRDEVLALHALRLFAQNQEIPLNRDTLIATFNNVFSTQNANAKAFVEKLEKYRTWIDENIIYLKEDGGQYDYKFRSEANAEHDEDDEKTEIKCMKQFQAMLYAASGDSQKWVLDAYSALNGGKLTLDFLRHLDANNHTKDDLDISSLSYLKKIDRYWFWKLDYILWEKCCLCKMDAGGEKNFSVSTGIHFEEKEMNAIRAYKFRRNISIEHLHPQSQGKNEGHADWGSRENADAPMHQFGNLAMISVNANSAQSDDGIGTKFGRVQDWINDGRLESIKMLIMFKLCGDDKSKWNVDVAKSHGEAMVKLLQEDRDCWIMPKAENKIL